jgi:hypothetical protein
MKKPKTTEPNVSTALSNVRALSLAASISLLPLLQVDFVLLLCKI